jgi:4a-hydroxytetrahydrobiopterin dehydratase
MRKLNGSEVAIELGVLPEWTLDPQAKSIRREYVLSDFMQAFAFMTQIAIAAEKHNHHPEWSNVYNRVSITWTTHDVDGLSANDLTLALFCDEAFAGYRPASR